MASSSVSSVSVKEQIILAAERLLAEHGLDGASLRQISAAAGNGNNTAVQYHFGSKQTLIQAIFEYRLRDLNARRDALVDERRPRDVRSWVACHVVPVLEQGERDGSRYLSFVAKLQQHGRRDVLDRLAPELLAPTTRFRTEVGALLAGVPEPLRGHRIARATAFAVHAGAEREQSRARAEQVLPFAAHAGDLLDGIVGFLQAPVSPATLTALDTAPPHAEALSLHP
ncbi:TetR/AcrR family transcriptional regulator [Streptomyces sp. NBC_01016]|uniref:TetR/AcrR family transcriptional regulator n=1 Tax=Streptomyces sp. NBC_01016 TaxID=2903720 RepID=UPI0022517E70|nr:TetR/AcrR family transcriptional regulator [Streptomyces sp. NBC_01016]MCX4831350.1 TetR/AcrR family transcriptional regulator [Streptomyces sp. NBC_01016]